MVINNPEQYLYVDRARSWQKEFSSLVLNLKFHLNHTNIFFDEDRRVHEVFAKLPFDLMRDRLWVSSFALGIFSVLAFMRSDWITSKPVLGIVGVISGSLATTATFGLLSLCGLEFHSLVASIPFLTLGD